MIHKFWKLYWNNKKVNHNQLWMVTRPKRRFSEDTVPKSKFQFLIYSQLYVRSLIKTNKLGPSNKSDFH